MQGYIEEAFDETLQTKTFVASKQDQGKLTTNKSVLSPMVIWLLVNRDYIDTCSQVKDLQRTKDMDIYL